MCMCQGVCEGKQRQARASKWASEGTQREGVWRRARVGEGVQAYKSVWVYGRARARACEWAGTGVDVPTILLNDPGLRK